MPWESVADSEVLSVHAALMPTNQILYFGGNEYVRDNNASTTFEKDVDKTRLFNLAPGKSDLVPGAPMTPLLEQSAGIFAALMVDEHGRMNVVWLDVNQPNPGWQGPVGFGGDHLEPGAPVTPLFQQNPGVFAALTVDRHGRMNVVWLDVNQPNPGWQGPVGFGGRHLKPGAPVTPVFEQSPGVFAALTIDRHGRTNVVWLDLNQPNPGWQGPVGFGGRHLKPGAPVTPVFEQSPGVFAALTIDVHGRTNVVWLDLNVPNPGWQGPVGFGGRHLKPGAPVTPVFEQSPGVFAALTIDVHGRTNVVWLDLNVPNPGWQGPVGFGGRHLKPGAPVTPVFEQSPGVFAALTIDVHGRTNVVWLDLNQARPGWQGPVGFGGKHLKPGAPVTPLFPQSPGVFAALTIDVHRRMNVVWLDLNQANPGWRGPVGFGGDHLQRGAPVTPVFQQKPGVFAALTIDVHGRTNVVWLDVNQANPGWQGPVGFGRVVETIGSPRTDVFCSAHVHLGDGRLLVVGGTEPNGWENLKTGAHQHFGGFSGEKACWTYHPWSRRWQRVRDLGLGRITGGGRWYPSTVALASGEVFAVAGHPSFAGANGRHNNPDQERYSASADTWTLLDGELLDPRAANDLRYYPRVHMLPDGNLFFVSPVANGIFVGGEDRPGSSEHCRVYDPIKGSTRKEFSPPAGGQGTELYNGTNFGSVLLPLLSRDHYKPRFMVCGDVRPRRIDLPERAPDWGSVGEVNWKDTAERTGRAAGRKRWYCCAVILPTGQIFVSGGLNPGTAADGGLDFDDRFVVREGELYSPGIDWETGGTYTKPDRWETVEAAQVARNYHSTAILMPNGRVWTAGSSKGHGEGKQFAEHRIEVWKPPYDGDPARPDLLSAPASVGYGQRFEIGCSSDGIGAVALVRCGSNTHGIDFDQRYVGLEFELVDSGRFAVQSPPNGAIAPPGYYLLWVLTRAGLPCKEARFIRIGEEDRQRTGGWQGPVGFGGDHLSPGASVSPVFEQNPGVFAALSVDMQGRMNVVWLDMNQPNPGWQGPVGFGGAHLAPGAPVSPVFEQSPGVFAALTVDRHGRMNVVWLDMNQPSPGWQGPVGFGGDHLAAGAPVSPVFEQNPGVFAALTVDRHGRMNVVWLDMNQPNPGWQGPVGFGGDHLAAGAPVSPVFEQNPGVFAALTVDRHGRMNVVWLDMNQPSPGWQGPVGFGGDHLSPGAPVSPVFEQSPGVFAALTVDRHGRMNVVWLDMNQPSPGWQGPVGFGGDHLSPGAPVSPVFEQSPGVFAALTVDRHGRMNVVWLDMNQPSPGWQGPVGFGDPHLAPGAPVSPVFAQNPGVFAALTVDEQGQMNVVWLDVNQASPGWQGPVGFGGSHLAPGAPVSPVFEQNPGVFAALTVDRRGRMNVAWLDTN